MHEATPLDLQQRPAELSVPVPDLRARRQRWRDVQLWVSLALAIGLVVVALAPQWFSPYDPNAISLSDILKPPSSAHWFGTDQLGRDLLSRVIWGSQISLYVAFCAVLLAGVFGSLFGIAAGYLGGWVDAVAMRLADIQLALPAVILALVLVGAIGFSVFNLVIVLSLANWARFARVTRSEALSLRSRDFVLLAKLAGASRIRVIFAHIVPNVINTFIVLATLDIGTIIILEATLSFLGLGVQPPTPSWGAMIADGRGYLETAWWICGIPGMVLMVAVLLANQLGDALRDRLSPTMSRGW
ncbi:ABC transporter permease subunit [Pandoraea fibrosis]|uniref:ABC transporter permease subunit n=1 Tax=Pandoraea fibrosis TaxID=1891094 RepID=A0ABX6HSJ9_9BURK|nr:ABC transporter permease [Pandoraea fibrosis]QHE92573.1 ABC transporter permease subunit [Pandoraea fibrosis]QHF13871.1 ABC transporter permease subunit [Pandoraea fibrosis]